LGLIVIFYHESFFFKTEFIAYQSAELALVSEFDRGPLPVPAAVRLL
jgi:hypothetical protein